MPILMVQVNQDTSREYELSGGAAAVVLCDVQVRASLRDPRRWYTGLLHLKGRCRCCCRRWQGTRQRS